MAFVLRTYKIAFVDIHYNDIYIYTHTHTIGFNSVSKQIPSYPISVKSYHNCYYIYIYIVAIIV